MAEDSMAVDVRRVDGPPDHYLDAAERLERVIDAQIETLDGIDEKAEHVTRLVGVLLGVVLSVAVRANGVQLSPVSVPTVDSFAVGLGGLLLAMITAIVTYLSSRFDIGVDETVGRSMSSDDYEIPSGTYARRTLGAYSHNIRRNRRVIEKNANRFRWTLVLLVVGVVYLALSTVLSAGRTVSLARANPVLDSGDETAIVLWTAAATVAVTWYVLSGRYLTVQEEGTTDD